MEVYALAYILCPVITGKRSLNWGVKQDIVVPKFLLVVGIGNYPDETCILFFVSAE